MLAINVLPSWQAPGKNANSYFDASNVMDFVHLTYIYYLLCIGYHKNNWKSLKII